MTCAETGEFTKKLEYIGAAAAIKTLLDDLQAWNDLNYAEITPDYLEDGATDTGDGLEDLQDLVNSVIGLLVSKSFDALTEMRKPLESDRTPYDLCFELYGTAINDVLDVFIESNDLAGDEIFLIPKGREIVWYI
jgi:hypothetical protein